MDYAAGAFENTNAVVYDFCESSAAKYAFELRLQL
jgi:hypothetical protein